MIQQESPDYEEGVGSFKFNKGEIVASVMKELFGLNTAFMEGRGRKSVVSELFSFGYEQAQLNEQKKLRASGEIEEDEILGLENWEAHLRANLESKQIFLDCILFGSRSYFMCILFSLYVLPFSHS